MKIFIWIFFVGIFFSCQDKRSEVVTDSRIADIGVELEKSIEKPYDAFKEEIPTRYIGKTVKQKQSILFNIIYSEMTEYWKETDWDFNGTTTAPKQGSIACGYLVTTILRDVGFKINRVKLAQAVSSKMIKLLCKPSTQKRFTSVAETYNYIQSNGLEYDIYLIGLDYHTGFILKHQQNVYFFHSDYFKDKVIVEEMESSYNLSTSNSFMIGSVLQNTDLLEAL